MSRSRSTATKVVATAVVVGLIGVVAGVGTWSAFSSTTQNEANSFATGTVTLTDNDSGSAMLTLSAAGPGANDTGCIDVTYTGSPASSVRLFGTTTGNLDPYLDLVVTRGTISSGAFDSCANFSPDTTNYTGAGNGVVYNGTLAGFADSYTAGIVDAPGVQESWSTNEKHAYRFSVTVQNNDSAQGKSSTQQFTWEARNN